MNPRETNPLVAISVETKSVERSASVSIFHKVVG